MKRIIAFFLTVVMLFSCAAVPALAANSHLVEPGSIGDPNNYGKHNLKDVALMIQYLAEWEVDEINLEAADCNCDGKVNLSDVTKLLQYLAGWGVSVPDGVE